MLIPENLDQAKIPALKAPKLQKVLASTSHLILSYGTVGSQKVCLGLTHFCKNFGNMPSNMFSIISFFLFWKRQSNSHFCLPNRPKSFSRFFYDWWHNYLDSSFLQLYAFVLSFKHNIYLSFFLTEILFFCNRKCKCISTCIINILVWTLPKILWPVSQNSNTKFTFQIFLQHPTVQFAWSKP